MITGTKGNWTCRDDIVREQGSLPVPIGTMIPYQETCVGLAAVDISISSSIMPDSDLGSLP